MANTLGNPGLVSDFAQRISRDGSLNVSTKSGLVKAMRDNPTIFTQAADCTAVNSATYANPTGSELTVNLKAGTAYKFSGYLHLTNAVGTDGIKAQLNLTGTQTNAFVNGFVSGMEATATKVPAALSISSGAVAICSSATSGATVMQFEGLIVPQNDGTFSVQTAEVANAGAGGSVLKKGSYLEIKELG